MHGKWWTSVRGHWSLLDRTLNIGPDLKQRNATVIEQNVERDSLLNPNVENGNAKTRKQSYYRLEKLGITECVQ